MEDGKYSTIILDRVFADCYRRWSGRFTLVVPCQNGEISEDYFAWMRLYDPDIIYSYVDLDSKIIFKIYEELNPSKYIRHEFRGGTNFRTSSFSPDYGDQLLSSLSTIFKRARYKDAKSSVTALSIIDIWHTETPTRFLTDNFGTYLTSYGTSILPSDASGAAQLLTIVDPEKVEDRHYAIPRNLNTIANEQDAFKAFADNKATSLSEASADFGFKLDIRSSTWSRTFNLVIGDSFEDRLLFWNARLLIPNYLGGSLGSFRIDQSDIKNQEFMEILARMLNNKNNINDGGGGQTYITVRSTSVDEDTLRLFAGKLRQLGCIHGVSFEHVEKLSSLVPDKTSFERVRTSTDLGYLLDFGSDWNEFQWEPPYARPTLAYPEHLADSPPRQQFSIGLWATEYYLELDGGDTRFGNRARWLLPRRWRLAGAFRITFSENVSIERLPQRASVGGGLVIFESERFYARAIGVPTPSEAIRHALWVDGEFRRSLPHTGPARPAHAVVKMTPSNEARYLNGVIGMAGDLLTACALILHPFLQGVFAALGGTPGLTIDRVQPTIARLQKLTPKLASFDITDSAERNGLADLLVKAARSLKTPMNYIRYEKIKEQWAGYRSAYWAKHESAAEGDEISDFDEFEAKSLEEGLIALRARKMLFQGHQWTCPECHHRNWVGLSDFKSRLECATCREEIDSPVDIEWHFKPNEFLIEALRDHSALSLLWVLSEIRNTSRQTFFYVGPTFFWYENPDSSIDSEADLLMVSDNKTYVAEVKSSWRSVRKSDIDDLKSICLRLRPHVALLAVMENGTGHNDHIEKARNELSLAGIELRCMTLDTNPLVDSPYLQA